MSQLSARLLSTAILDNTLNFQANITTSEDQQAYEQLIKIAELPKNWTLAYFKECQQTILQDFEKAVINDMKWLTLGSLEVVLIGQIVVWDVQPVLLKIDRIKNILGANGNHRWFVNIVDLQTNKSVIICDNHDIQAHLKVKLGLNFTRSVGYINKCWLRKEIWAKFLT